MSPNKQIAINFITTFVMLALRTTNISLVRAEIYNSVEGLSNWPNIRKLFYDEVSEYVKVQEDTLNKLHRLQDTLSDLEKEDELFSSPVGNLTRPPNLSGVAHPVMAFVNLNRIIKRLNHIHSIFDIDQEEEDKLGQLNSRIQLSQNNLFEQITHQHNLPTDDDLIGCGEALLRLQAFYELEIDDIVYGKLSVDLKKFQGRTQTIEGNNRGRIMQSEDCFELGKIAYDSEHYAESINWFKKALELTKDRYGHINDNPLVKDPITSLHEDINEILEYMAFAAYKSGQIKYSAQLTKLWLERDPDNERAKGNLEYYEEELTTDCLEDLETSGEVSDGRSNSHRDSQLNLSNVYYSNAQFNPSDYVVEEDKIVRDLCRGNVDNVPTKSLKCMREETLTKNYMISPEAKIEVLSQEPYIMRIYDAISDREAEHLQRLAFPKLSRSTVQTRIGLTTSDFRIAKTAWLSQESDYVVYDIERRLSNLLGLNFHGSEETQVVNYGLGGFYGPHLDSARESSIDSYNSVPVSNLVSNDRLATILLYLNHVEAGGSTVFPRLNVTVLPIKKSAVVWYNIKRNGFSDERTLHTGCPILLGSKWIATKWPREVANSFIRPCGLKQED